MDAAQLEALDQLIQERIDGAHYAANGWHDEGDFRMYAKHLDRARYWEGIQRALRETFGVEHAG